MRELLRYSIRLIYFKIKPSNKNMLRLVPAVLRSSVIARPRVTTLMPIARMATPTSVLRKRRQSLPVNLVRLFNNNNKTNALQR